MDEKDLAGYLRRIMVSLNQATNTISSMAAGIIQLEKEVIDSYRVEISESAKKKSNDTTNGVS